MCNYEKLLHDASMIGLEVKEIQFESDAKGLCKGQKIGIRKDLSDAEKACVLAEEIGHYYTTVGNILNQKNTENRKKLLHSRSSFFSYNSFSSSFTEQRILPVRC